MSDPITDVGYVDAVVDAGHTNGGMPRVKLQFFAPPVEQVTSAVDVGLFPVAIGEALAQTTPAPVAPVAPVDPPRLTTLPESTAITLGVVPAATYGVCWLLLVIGMGQVVKRGLYAVGLKQRMTPDRWRAWKFVIPPFCAALLGFLYGPQFTAAVGFPIAPLFEQWPWTDRLSAMLLLTATTAPASAYLYDVLRETVLPVLPIIVIAKIEKWTKITLPDAVRKKATQWSADSEAFSTLDGPSDQSEVLE